MATFTPTEYDPVAFEGKHTVYGVLDQGLPGARRWALSVPEGVLAGVSTVATQRAALDAWAAGLDGVALDAELAHAQDRTVQPIPRSRCIRLLDETGDPVLLGLIAAVEAATTLSLDVDALLTKVNQARDGRAAL